MVKIKVDSKRRNDLRRLHTATHIINFSARSILGNHIWQNGSNLKPEMGTLDITHYDNIKIKEILEIEKLANKAVFENKKVTVEEIDRTDAEKKYGYTIYQGGAIPLRNLRIVKVEDNDIEACGGIHMETTAGIGLIKIVSAQKIQDGIVRLSFVVNEYALEELSKSQTIVEEIKEAYSTDEGSIVSSAKKFFNEWKEQKKEIEKTKEKLLNIHTENILKDKNLLEYIIEEDVDMGSLVEIFTKVIKTKKSFRLDSKKFILATKDINIENTKKNIDKKDFVIGIK